jgi:hypothetical protein
LISLIVKCNFIAKKESIESFKAGNEQFVNDYLSYHNREKHGRIKPTKGQYEFAIILNYHILTYALINRQK